MNRAATVALAVALASACRSEVGLGDPDAGGGAPPATGTVAVPPRCSGAASRTVIATADDSWGELRAMTAGGGNLYAVFARGAAGEGVLARAGVQGGSLTEVARVGENPSSIALAPDASFVFAAASGSSQIFRVDRSSGILAANAGGSPSSIVADARGGAFWTLPANDAIFAWSFDGGAPRSIATTPRPTSIVRAGNTLYITGGGSVRAFDPAVDAAPRNIADRCDAGAPAIDGTSLYCADAGAIARVDLSSGTSTVIAPAQPGARDVVVGAGRVFWRAAPSAEQTLVMALPLDGIGGPTVVESSGPGSLSIALDGCDLYFTAGRSFVRLQL